MSADNSGIFAAAELGSAVSKEDYQSAVEALRVELLNLQFDLKDSGFSLILLLTGDDRPGVIDLMRTLNEWVDPRYVETHAMFDQATPEEAARPALWRYWSRLPPAGRSAVFLGGWPVQLVRATNEYGWSEMELEGYIDHAERFERELSLERVLLLKFWVHLPKQAHEDRLKDAEKNPEKYWRFEQRDWEILDAYDNAMELVERVIRRTNTPYAPWSIVEGTDPRYRNLTVGTQVAAALRHRLERAAAPPEPPVVIEEPGLGQSLLEQIDLSATADPDTYSEELRRLQARLNELAHAASDASIASVLVFEGVDAAGKGGTIRRIHAALPIQHAKLIPIAAPTDEELARHYLWRFWRHVPARGKFAIFDRSWYGRVLVERVEGLADHSQWSRAFEEINDFESMLHRSGIPVIKFWLQIDKDEQLRRFEARAQTAYKKYKLTDEDFRNREKWDDYQQAAHDMLARTNTSFAPWYAISSMDKRHARLTALERVCDRLEERVVEVLGESWHDKVSLGPPESQGNQGKKKNGKNNGKSKKKKK